MPRLIAASLTSLTLLAMQASAQNVITTPFDGDFDDATFAVESAIMDRGLVIDHVSHVGDMLNRTGADVASAQTIFDNADIFIFCSAVISRHVMELDPMNIVYCPYGIFVAEHEGGVMIGYRSYPEGPMQVVQSLLAEIVGEAAE